jgi:hypothetical protein
VSEGVRASFIRQAAHCDSMGSPLTARVLRMLAAEMLPGPVADRVLGWPGDSTSQGDAVALRLAAGLHALVLSGADAGLAAAYATPDAPDTDLRAALKQAFTNHADHLLHWLHSPPQTNEVRRSAVLIAAGHWLADRFGLPMVLSELGASAGLNLLWDRYVLDLPGASLGPPEAPVRLAPDWTGALPPAHPPQIAARAGVDLNPLDPGTDRLRILSYI